VTVDRSRLLIPEDRPFHFRASSAALSPTGSSKKRCVVIADRVDGAARARRVVGRSALVTACVDDGGLLDEGARPIALEIAERVARIGGDLDVEVGMDAVAIGLTTLDRFFERGLELVHEIVTVPNLANDDFNRIRNLRLERLAQMKDHAAAIAERAFARVLYGSNPYGHLSLGSEPALTAMTVDAVRAMHAALFTPAGATLVIVGDRSEEQLLDLAAAMFDPCSAAASTITIDRAAGLATPPSTPLARLAVIHRPGAAQSELRIGHVCAARSTPDYPQLLVLNAILGGEFVSRLNLNLRESKGYTYGVRTGFNLRRGIGPFLTQTSVGTDTPVPRFTKLPEIHAIADHRPATGDDVAQAFASLSKDTPAASKQRDKLHVCRTTCAAQSSRFVFREFGRGLRRSGR
jgi:predicted Zn-dependent peptidase